MNQHRRTAGFTLIEMLVVVSVAAILASLAVASYSAYVQQSRRADAKAALNALAQRLERCYTQFGRYDHDDCGIDAPYNSPEGHYSIDLAEVTAATYALSATPTGAQANDSRCTGFTLNQLGEREATGSHADDCW